MFDADRRKYPRANYPCQLTVWLANGLNETMLANTSNIGLAGLCVHLNQAVRVGTKVDIQLQFTDTATPFRCRGVVAHSGQERERFYKIGIKFEPLNELKTAFLSRKISELSGYEQKGKS